MASRYDAFRYIPALINDIQTHPIETLPDDINRMVQIVKDTPFTTLTHYANMEDEFGEVVDQSDPRFGEIKKKQVALFTILFHVWGWQETIVFYLRYAGSEKKSVQSKLQKENDSLRAEISTLKFAISSGADTINILKRKNEKCKETIKTQAEEILHLKARLYDLMNKGE